MKDNPTGRVPPPLDEATRNRLAALVAVKGETAALAALNLPRATFARAVAGLPVRKATAEVIRLRLAALDGGRDAS